MVWTWEAKGWMDWPCGLFYSLFKKWKPMKGWGLFGLYFCVFLSCFAVFIDLPCANQFYSGVRPPIIPILNPVYKALIGLLLFGFVIACGHRFKGLKPAGEISHHLMCRRPNALFYVSTLCDSPDFVWLPFVVAYSLNKPILLLQVSSASLRTIFTCRLIHLVVW